MDRRSRQTVMRKFVKAYRKVAFYMMDIALFNSYIRVIYNKLRKKNGVKTQKRNYEGCHIDQAKQI